MPTEPRVLVTGVSGFIASWVAYAALHQGYRVRGTVRSLANEDKVRHLRDLCPGSKHKMELVEADLTSDDGWDAAVAGCHYILHVASPFVVSEPRDPDELIGPAVDGTLRVLRAAAKLSVKPRRVVVTSSCASVANGHCKTDFNDDDWTILDNPSIPVSAYPRSKTMAERAAWDFVANLSESERFELATVNPSAVLGPMLSSNSCASGEIVGKILMAGFPALPDVKFGKVSVFDVARAHILAMAHPDAAGKRFIVSEAESGLQDYARTINREFRQFGYSPVSMHVPNFVLHVMAFFGDREAKSSAPYLCKVENFHCNNARNILGMTLTNEFDLVKEMTLAMIANGLLPDKSKDKILTKNYKRPEFDLSMLPTAPCSEEESH